MVFAKYTMNSVFLYLERKGVGSTSTQCKADECNRKDSLQYMQHLPLLIHLQNLQQIHSFNLDIVLLI